MTHPGRLADQASAASLAAGQHQPDDRGPVPRPPPQCRSRRPRPPLAALGRPGLCRPVCPPAALRGPRGGLRAGRDAPGSGAFPAPAPPTVGRGLPGPAPTVADGPVWPAGDGNQVSPWVLPVGTRARDRGIPGHGPAIAGPVPGAAAARGAAWQPVPDAAWSAGPRPGAPLTGPSAAGARRPRGPRTARRHAPERDASERDATERHVAERYASLARSAASSTHRRGCRVPPRPRPPDPRPTCPRPPGPCLPARRQAPPRRGADPRPGESGSTVKRGELAELRRGDHPAGPHRPGGSRPCSARAGT